MRDEYINGFLERKRNGVFEGDISIEGVNLSPIVGVFFKKDAKTYLWIKRKDVLEYDDMRRKYVTRKRSPQWETYMVKTMDEGSVAFRGEFAFMRLRWSVVGVWDKVLGMDKNRMNIFVERLPIERQDLIREKI